MTTSILIEDVCFECNKDNGIQSSTHCKYCNEPLIKNKWLIEIGSYSELIVSGTTPINIFEKFNMDDETYVGINRAYTYNFMFNKFNINFENERLVFKVKELPKPLIINFDSILDYEISYSKSRLMAVMTIILKNNLVVGIGYNTYNEKLYKIFKRIIN